MVNFGVFKFAPMAGVCRDDRRSCGRGCLTAGAGGDSTQLENVICARSLFTIGISKVRNWHRILARKSVPTDGIPYETLCVNYPWKNPSVPNCGPIRTRTHGIFGCFCVTVSVKLSQKDRVLVPFGTEPIASRFSSTVDIVL